MTSNLFKWFLPQFVSFPLPPRNCPSGNLLLQNDPACDVLMFLKYFAQKTISILLKIYNIVAKHGHLHSL